MNKSTNHLQASVQGFNRKKQACLAFIEEAREVLTEYETYFPPTVSVENAENSHLNTLLLNQVEEKIKSSSLKILVAGQFKAGKSTMLNAILSEKILPAYSRPCTAVITEISYADEKKAVISFKNDLNIDTLPKDLNEKSREHIEKHAGNVPDLEVSVDEMQDYLVISKSKKAQEDAIAESPYALCSLFYPLEICKNGAQIIDSPGLNEHAARTKTTMEYVPQADIVLHVLSAQQCCSQADQVFLEDIQSLGKFPILFLVNRFDQLNTKEDRKDIKEYALSELLEYSTYGEDGIFFLSAHQALEGRIGSDVGKLLTSGIVAFERKLGNIFDSERTKIKLAHIECICNAVMYMANNYLPNLQIMLNKDAQTLEKELKFQQKSFDRLEKRRQHIEQAFSKGITNCYNEIYKTLNIFFDQFLEKIDENLLKKVTLDPRGKKDNKEYGEYVAKKCSEFVERKLLNELSSWQKNVAQTIFEQQKEEIKQETQYDIEEFCFQLDKVQHELSMKSFFGDADVSDSLVLGTLLGGSVGGGLAAGGLFIASRFFLAALGPAGWAIAGVTTVAAALGGFWMGKNSDEKIVDEVKKAFLPEIKKYISDEKYQWMYKIATESRTYLRKTLDPISTQITKALVDTKNIAESAIFSLAGDSEKNKEQREKLVEIIEKFKKASNNGKDLVQSL